MQQEPRIDVKNLCSRKLWEILLAKQNQQLSYQQRTHVEQELITRQHYLQELANLARQVH